MNIHVIYRVCDKKDAVHGLPRPFGLDKVQIIKACFSSLLKSLAKVHWSMTIISDNVNKGTKEWILGNIPKNMAVSEAKYEINDFPFKGKLPLIEVPRVETQRLKDEPITEVSNIFNDNYVRWMEFDAPIGHLTSTLTGIEVAETIVDGDTWVYYLEDDYLHNWDQFLLRLQDFELLQKNINFAMPVFIHPSDYPDQYSRLLARNFLFQSAYGYWREVSSTTLTFLCQAKTFKRFAKVFKDDPVDGKFSNIFRKQALCFSPLPGIATHMHEPTMSAYINWQAYLPQNE